MWQHPIDIQQAKSSYTNGSLVLICCDENRIGVEP